MVFWGKEGTWRELLGVCCRDGWALQALVYMVSEAGTRFSNNGRGLTADPWNVKEL